MSNVFQSEQIQELAAALSKAQAEMEPAVLDKENHGFRKPDGTPVRYASLTSIMNVFRKHFAPHGLSISQVQVHSDNGVAVLTTLMHTSGQYLCGQTEVPLAKSTPQAVGSGLTYAKRHGMAITGIVADDDDDAHAAEEAASKTLSEDQVKEVEDLLKSIDKDDAAAPARGVLLRSLKVPSVDKILLTDYDRVIRSLTKKLNSTNGSTEGNAK